MPKQAKALSDKAVTALRRPGLHFVGGVPGLAVQVLETGARSWVLRATIAGKRRDMGLGPLQEVSLAEAREKALAARKRIRAGADPIAEARESRAARQVQPLSVTSFREIAQAYIVANEAAWRNPKHQQQWRNTLETYVYPILGDLPVGDVDTERVLAVLRQPVTTPDGAKPLWEGRPETGSRIRGRIEAVLDFAKMRNLRDAPNPAAWKGHLALALPPRSKVRRVRHHPALPVADMPRFMARLRASDGLGARALEYAIFTAGRSGEVRGSRWAEVDLDAAIWIIPASRMKAGREHRVPLSSSAVDLLRALPKLVDADLIFPSTRGGQLSDATLLSVLRRMKVTAVPHGFRSTFRDWAAEKTAYPHEMAEMALAHTIGNRTEAAYRRGDLLEKRRAMMQDWCDFLAANAPVDLKAREMGKNEQEL